MSEASLISYQAVVNVIDFDELAAGTPEMAYDMPAGGKRPIQHVTGYDATVLSGMPVDRDRQATGPLPGWPMHGAKSEPIA